MIYLSFDTEEFDVPREYGIEFNTLKEGMLVSQYGIERILQILDEESVKATFFCTSNFVLNATDLVRRIEREGHEIASHGCDHWAPKTDDAKQSKKIIEDKIGVGIAGYRQPRMFTVDNNELANCGYRFNASLNPTFIPGRYSHLRVSRIPWIENGVVQIPTSVSPYLRIPMFWLSLHHFPLNTYLWLMERIVNHDNGFNTYFHPWEFYPLNDHPEFNIPYFIRRKAGVEMEQRLKLVIEFAKSRGYKFGTYSEYANEILK
jgi:peptidoglycan/xylan/chitin deacetylase (PgdA/CDA1 family)